MQHSGMSQLFNAVSQLYESAEPRTFVTDYGFSKYSTECQSEFLQKSGEPMQFPRGTLFFKRDDAYHVDANHNNRISDVICTKIPVTVHSHSEESLNKLKLTKNTPVVIAGLHIDGIVDKSDGRIFLSDRGRSKCEPMPPELESYILTSQDITDDEYDDVKMMNERNYQILLQYFTAMEDGHVVKRLKKIKQKRKK